MDAGPLELPKCLDQPFLIIVVDLIVTNNVLHSQAMRPMNLHCGRIGRHARRLTSRSRATGVNEDKGSEIDAAVTSGKETVSDKLAAAHFIYVASCDHGQNRARMEKREDRTTLIKYFKKAIRDLDPSNEVESTPEIHLRSQRTLRSHIKTSELRPRTVDQFVRNIN
jgi:hypothetical protein